MAVDVKVAVMTVSDSRHAANDSSGDILTSLLTEFGAIVVERLLVTDDLSDISDMLFTLSERAEINLIVTTGGTGFGPRDNTPEATRAVIEREAPGLAEAMRRQTADATPLSMLSRSVCGIRGSTLILNLPGSPKGVAECFEVIRPVLRHAVDLINGDTKH